MYPHILLPAFTYSTFCDCSFTVRKLITKQALVVFISQHYNQVSLLYSMCMFVCLHVCVSLCYNCVSFYHYSMSNHLPSFVALSVKNFGF
jgi:hypothetical protein